MTLWVTIVCSQALAQPPAPANGPVERLRRADSALTAPLDSPAAQARERSLIADVLTPESTLRLDPRRSILVRTRLPVARFSITHPDLVDIVQYSPTEFELLGLRNGETTLTMWFLGPNNTQEVLRYVVQVARDETATERHREAYHDLQKMVNEMWPNSMVQIIPVADKIIVRGQARDAKEAAEILSLVTGQTVGQRGNLILTGTATPPYPDATDVPASQVINLLMVPGEMQVLLKVRIAEISRSALRQIGTDLNVRAGDFRWNQLLGVAGAFQAVLETDDVRLALSAVSSNAYSKILAEPNLVTLSGRPASFIAGGEFAVPIVVGVEGAAAATTNFRGFGTQVTFVPTVIDKDQIRLQVAPSFSSLNQANAVNGIPGLDTRAVTTTVDLREGQWLAIAGLIQDEQEASKVRVPLLGDIPIVDTLFSRKSVVRDETELIILVSPELVHPLDPQEAPLILPGMEVTEPSDFHFFIYGDIERWPPYHHRSTVWPVEQRKAIEAHHHAVREAKMHRHYQRSECYYLQGDHGFSR